MARAAEAIHIRIAEREGRSQIRDPREAFWAPFRERNADNSVAQLEARLCREFGPALRASLFESLSEPIKKLDSELFQSSLREFERGMFHFGPPEKEWYRYQFGDALSKFFDYRRDVLASTPGLRDVQERIVTAGSIVFATRIIGYSSLNLDLATGSFEKLAKIFDGHFDELRVFFEAFAPVAFASVFDQEFADRFSFEPSIPQSAEDAFVEVSNLGASGSSVVKETASSRSIVTSTRERAEWLWRLANGSLLIPVIIALLVMFYGMRMLSDIRKTQDEALRPILQHELELLREDRSRLSGAGSQGKDESNGTPPAPAKKSGTAQPTTP